MKVNGHEAIPDRLDLERKLSSVFADDRAAVTSAELRALMQETESGIVDAQEAARLAKADALDPTVTPNPTEARSRMEDAALAAGRLHTLLGRLQRRYAEVAEAERFAAWQADFNDLRKQRDALAGDLAKVYPEVTATLTDLFTRIALLDQKLSTLHQARGAGVQLHLLGAELIARELERFTRDVPSLLQSVVLLDFNSGTRVWPPVVPRDMTMFQPVPFNPRYSSRWWETQAAEAEARKQEQKRLDEYYEQQQRGRREREEEIVPRKGNEENKPCRVLCLQRGRDGRRLRVPWRDRRGRGA
jgi:hypothetical protein